MRDSHGRDLPGRYSRLSQPREEVIVQILDRLVRDELVTGKTVPQTDRPDKIVYRLTKKGRGGLERWLGQPFVRQSGYRDDFFLKLLAASRLGEEPLRDTLRVQREASLAELASLNEPPRRRPAAAGSLVEAALLHAQANLRLVELAEKQLPELIDTVEGSKAQPAAARKGRSAA